MGSGILKNCWICFTVFPRRILKNYKCIKRINDLIINFDLHYLQIPRYRFEYHDHKINHCKKVMMLKLQIKITSYFIRSKLHHLWYLFYCYHDLNMKTIMIHKSYGQDCIILLRSGITVRKAGFKDICSLAVIIEMRNQ